MDDDTNVKVFCRVRPPNDRERLGVSSTGASSSSTCLTACSSGSSASYVKKCVTVPASDPAQQTLLLHSKHVGAKTFTFDRVFGEDASQNDVFKVIGAPITQACLDGYNGTIFAYGQTGSGKTFTMQGAEDVIINADATTRTSQELSLRGLVPRVFDYLFDNVVATDKRAHVQHTFACSFLEIYNERVYDLLDRGSAKDAAGLQLRENGRKGVHVEGLIESEVTNSKEAAELMTIGTQNRRVGQTSMNRESSRSHSVFILQLQSREVSPQGTKIRTSRFNLVDLAGSERQRSTDAVGERLKEAGNINKSLSALGNVILRLSEQSVGKHRHVHYRDSKLTFLLKDSLGGNSKTFVIATISPAEESAFETLSTLKFAQRAKMIQNSAIVNEDSVGSSVTLQDEIQRLRRQLQQAHQQIARGVPQSRLLVEKGSASAEVALSGDTATASSQLLGLCDPAVDARFRELEESFARTAENNGKLQRLCEHLQLRNENFQVLSTKLKQNVAQLKMMLRLRGIGGTGVDENKPSADAIEWRMKYEEMEQRMAVLQDELQRCEVKDAGDMGKASSEVENMNIMILALTKQLAFVLRDKHDLQDRLLHSKAHNDESMEGFSSQEAVDFSVRLDEALKQQANEHQIKLDSVSSVNACLEEKAAEASLQLLQMKEFERAWSIRVHDLERQLADSGAALRFAEQARSVTVKELVEEKARTEKMEAQFERACEGMQFESETALADAATTNRSLERSKELLEHQLTAITTGLEQREHQIEKAESECAQLKVELMQLKESHQRTVSELGKARIELDESSLEAGHLRAKVFDHEDVINELKRTADVSTEEKIVLEGKLEELNDFIKQLQENAGIAAQQHTETIGSLKRQAQEHEYVLVEDYSEKLRVRGEQYQHLRAELDDRIVKTREAVRLHSLALEEKDLALTALKQQSDDETRNFELALEGVRHELHKSLADVSKLSEEKVKLESDRASAAQAFGKLQEAVKKLDSENNNKAGEIQILSQRLEDSLAKAQKLDDQKVELQKKCELQYTRLSASEETIEKLTREVGQLQQQIIIDDVDNLRKQLVSVKEDCCRAAATHSHQLIELVAHAKRNEKLQQELVQSKSAVHDMTHSLEEALKKTRDAEEVASRQQEEMILYQETHSKLRDELKTLELDRLKLTEALKIEQEAKQDVENALAEARVAWMSEKFQLTQRSQESVLAVEKRVDEMRLRADSLSALKRELVQESKSLKVLVVEQRRTLEQLEDQVADRDSTICVLESSAAHSVVTHDKLAGNIAELQDMVHNLERQLLEHQDLKGKQEAELAEKTTAVSDRDGLIATLKDRARNDKMAWDLKTRKYEDELGSTRVQVQALEQLVTEKATALAKAEESFLALKHSLQQKVEEKEKLLAQQTERLMHEIKQLRATVEQKDGQIELATASAAEFEKRLALVDKSVSVNDPQVATKKLESADELAMRESTSAEAKTMFDGKEQKHECDSSCAERDFSGEHVQSVRKVLAAQQVVAESVESAERTVDAAKAKAALHQAKRKHLAETMKLQREIQCLTKKVETVSKENEKLIGHHNSRQKIHHHVKVKEENNRLLDQIRLLTDNKLKLQRSLEKLRTMLKEKENIVSSTPPALSPILNVPSSGPLQAKKAKRPSPGSAPSTTAVPPAKVSTKLAMQSRPTSRSASPGPPRKRVKAPSSSSGPSWQR
uniref:Kinesin motor domain-containing protein n=1 Tax=Peronospora matthiolae TaxID=2874970 RepID=A0AAV1UHT5_9STRA